MCSTLGLLLVQYACSEGTAVGGGNLQGTLSSLSDSQCHATANTALQNHSGS